MIKPLKNMILVRPNREATSKGSIIQLDTDRFPTSGWVYSLSDTYKGILEVDDFVIFEEHGVDVPPAYNDTFFIRCRDNAGEHIIRADRDLEPVIKEAVHMFRVGKIPDRRLAVRDINYENAPVSFLISDIVDMGIGTYTESGYSLSYRHHTELHSLDTGIKHPPLMLVPEKEILAFIRVE